MLPYIHLFEKNIPTYGICMVLGLMTSAIWACFRANKRGLSVEDLIVYLGCTTGMTLAGAKIMYCLVSVGVNNSIHMVLNGQFDELFANGGFVFYGGLLGGMLGILPAKILTKVEPNMYYTSVVPVIPIGHAMGRAGCFLAGCCFGKEYKGIGSVKFPHSIAGLSPEISVIPVQLLEAAGDLLIAVYLLKICDIDQKEENVLCRYIVLYSLMRFCLEFLRGDPERGSFAMFSISQCVSIVLIAGCGIGRCIKQQGSTRVFP